MSEDRLRWPVACCCCNLFGDCGIQSGDWFDGDVQQCSNADAEQQLTESVSCTGRWSLVMRLCAASAGQHDGGPSGTKGGSRFLHLCTWGVLGILLCSGELYIL